MRATLTLALVALLAGSHVACAQRKLMQAPEIIGGIGLIVDAIQGDLDPEALVGLIGGLTNGTGIIGVLGDKLNVTFPLLPVFTAFLELFADLAAGEFSPEAALDIIDTLLNVNFEGSLLVRLLDILDSVTLGTLAPLYGLINFGNVATLSDIPLVEVIFGVFNSTLQTVLASDATVDVSLAQFQGLGTLQTLLDAITTGDLEGGLGLLQGVAANVTSEVQDTLQLLLSGNLTAIQDAVQDKVEGLLGGSQVLDGLTDLLPEGLVQSVPATLQDIVEQVQDALNGDEDTGAQPPGGLFSFAIDAVGNLLAALRG